MKIRAICLTAVLALLSASTFAEDSTETSTGPADPAKEANVGTSRARVKSQMPNSQITTSNRKRGPRGKTGGRMPPAGSAATGGTSTSPGGAPTTPYGSPH